MSEAPLLPHEFLLKQNWVSLHSRITIEYDGHELGSIHQELISIHTIYHLNDKKGHTVALAKKKTLAIGDEYTIRRKDKTGSKYTISEQIIDSALSVGTIYKIKKDGKTAAKCRKTDILHKSVSITPKIGSGSAGFQKNWLGLHDTWQVKVSSDFVVESYVIAFFAAIIQIVDKKEKKVEEAAAAAV